MTTKDVQQLFYSQALCIEDFFKEGRGTTTTKVLPQECAQDLKLPNLVVGRRNIV